MAVSKRIIKSVRNKRKKQKFKTESVHTSKDNKQRGGEDDSELKGKKYYFGVLFLK